MVQLTVSRRHLLLGAPFAAMQYSLSARRMNSTQAGSLNFLVVGDWGRNGKLFQRHVARHMAREGAAISSRFVVSTGDNFYQLGVSSPDDSQWETSFESIYTEAPLQTPWFAVLGNHDYGGNVEAQLFRRALSRDRWRMERRWYDVNAGAEFGRSDVHLFFIDTVVWRGRESFPYQWLGSRIRSQDREQQREWLTKTLTESGARIKIVFGHHPIYSVGKHGGDIGMADLNHLLRQARVTAYISGHDHCLYHIVSDGMNYICSGGGSEELPIYTGGETFGCVFKERCPAEIMPDEGSLAWRQFIGRAGFTAFSVGDHQIDFWFVDRDGMRSHPAMLTVPA